MKTNTSLSTVNCHWEKILKLVSAVLLGAALLAPQPVAAQDATVVAIFRGGGTAIDDVGQMGACSFSTRVELLSDGAATGFFRVRQHSRPGSGDFSLQITSWSIVFGGPFNGTPFLVLQAGNPNQLGSATVRVEQYGGGENDHFTIFSGITVLSERVLNGGMVLASP